MTEIFEPPCAVTAELCPELEAKLRTIRACESKVNLLRREAALWLEFRYGILIAAATLARLASEGRGPRFHRLRTSRSVLYSRDSLDEWAREELGEEARSTLEHNQREREA